MSLKFWHPKDCLAYTALPIGLVYMPCLHCLAYTALPICLVYRQGLVYKDCLAYTALPTLPCLHCPAYMPCLYALPTQPCLHCLAYMPCLHCLAYTALRICLVYMPCLYTLRIHSEPHRNRHQALQISRALYVISKYQVHFMWCTSINCTSCDIHHIITIVCKL